MGLHELANGFTDFSYLTIYQLTFFILFTTIGLNVIFGIIVDTFSELRDLKWMAEKDMRSTCFICSRDSYDFESAAQVTVKLHLKYSYANTNIQTEFKSNILLFNES